VATRLLICVREGDTVARLGGDEFVVMLEGLSESKDEVAQHCEAVGEKILNMLGQPYVLNGHEVRSTPSLGITLFDGHSNLIDELLKQADLAMYQSKAAGRNTLRFFDAAMQGVVNERAALESDLRDAIRKKQFVLHYQPQIVGRNRLIGAEALVRWNHPKRGMVSPAAFIPLAEETGLILELGTWVLETACAQLSIAVNVSAKQLHQNEFAAQVLDILQRTGANPKLLKLELTESLLVTDIEKIIAKMTMLKSMGVGFSLDDFGTGYSSLGYLKRLPLDQLKIDQGFVHDVLIDPNDAAIAKMIIALAATLGLTVIAEGVELQGQLDFLASQGCHTYQGYFFSKPLPIAEFESFAQRQAR
jgi:predicted signal transduction protein with EAL and GGDEF domain